jgi:serine/threonine protein kinase
VKQLDPDGDQLLCYSLCSALLGAVLNLHSHSVMHGDIKPENILFDFIHARAVVELCDLDNARKFEEPLCCRTGSTKAVFTTEYCCPEMLAHDSVNNVVAANAEIDTFAVGLVLYELLNRSRPSPMLLNSEADLLELFADESKFDLSCEHLIRRACNLQRNTRKLVLREWHAKLSNTTFTNHAAEANFADVVARGNAELKQDIGADFLKTRRLVLDCAEVKTPSCFIISTFKLDDEETSKLQNTFSNHLDTIGSLTKAVKGLFSKGGSKAKLSSTVSDLCVGRKFYLYLVDELTMIPIAKDPTTCFRWKSRLRRNLSKKLFQCCR